MIPLSHRVIHSPISYCSYLGKIFWPANLAVCYASPSEVEYGLAALSALLLLGISVLAVAWRNSRPYFLIGWLWYLGTLVPVIGFVQVGAQGMADRYTYIPSIGVFLALTWLLADLAARSRARLRNGSRRGNEADFLASARNRPPRYLGGYEAWMQAMLAGASLFALAACAVLSYSQIKTWRNTRTLFEHALKVTERNFMAYSALGDLLELRAGTEAALKTVAAALATLARGM